MPLEAYITELRDIRRSGAGVKETSYYPALSALLNEAGKPLKPRVRCIINIANRGAGIPDGGLFTPDQFQRVSDGEPLPGMLPSRGAIEVKGTGEDVVQVAQGEQVSRYVEKYGQVLVTNLRSFAIVGRDSAGRPKLLETFDLAPTEADFWHAAAHPRTLAGERGERFAEYLRRALTYAAPLAEPKAVAWFLASYAREAKARVEGVELEALAHLREALQQALGLTFEGEKGDHFFRATLIQTLFYGVFSAWVLWAKGQSAASTAPFNWHEAGWYLRVPMISALFQQIATPDKLEPLGLVEVLDWTADALNRVDRGQFFSRFEEEHAVQYFYEPFLEAYDPELRKELGVWYTPPEIVKYMVTRVDTVLREELDIPDGLADPRVYILDPCCGTGAYLVEVIGHIAATLRAKGEDALLAHEVKRAVKERVFGFEILPAPFVVAHLQIGLLLQNLGAPLSPQQGERPGVYLTNALTGWEPPTEPKSQIPFPGMEQEREAADEVKRDKDILVILGNPPYNGFAGVAIDEERELSNAYRTTKRAPAPQGQGLNDLYVRFFRMAERRIVEVSRRGVVCFISNYSWLDGLSFTGMRERYLEAFDKIWVDCLNGDKYKTGKLTPEGKPDPSVFSSKSEPIGIQVGTAVSLLLRTEAATEPAQPRFRHLWGATKLEQLTATAVQDGVSLYEELHPPVELGLPLMPAEVAEEYLSWPLLTDLFPVSYPGVKTSRDDFVVDIDRDRLEERLRAYFDPAVPHEDMRALSPQAMASTARFDAAKTRDRLRARGCLWETVVRYYYRPFDVRWLYWEPEGKLLDEKRADYFAQVFDGNSWLSAGQRNRKDAFYQPQCVRCLADHHLVESNVGMFPLYLRTFGARGGLSKAGEDHGADANTSSDCERYLQRVQNAAAALFWHTIAVLHSPQYVGDNAGALRQNYPRIPLPATAELLSPSAALGERIAELLDAEKPLAGIETGDIPPDMAAVARLSAIEGQGLNPDRGDLRVTAGWGHDQRGAVMPGAGRVVGRPFSPDELTALSRGAEARGMTLEQALAQLGESTCDVFLNDVAFWRCVPAKVWEYTIGGYQVIKKWLSYREHRVLGRDLKPDEARYVTHMARRIAEILLLQPQLDENYRRVKENTFDWSSLNSG